MSDHEIYKTFCEPRFEAIQRDLKEIHGVVCGNGKEGLDEKVRRHDCYFGRIFWAIGITFVAMVGALVKVLFGVVK